MINSLIYKKDSNAHLYTELVQRGFHPLIATILSSRVDSFEEAVHVLNPDIKSLIPSPFVYQDMEKAAERIANAIIEGEKIVCAVDFDSDGINSGAIFYRAMTESFFCPAKNIRVQISHRTLWGYGFTDYAVKNIFRHDSGNLPALIITADQGSSNEEEIRLALQMADELGHGLDVIVTDHHKIPEKWPESAYAFVNPQRQLELQQEFKDICGATVMFLTMLATKEKLVAAGHIPQDTKLFHLLSNCSVATISDVMSLKSPLNRAICHNGFRLINESRHPSWSLLRHQNNNQYIEEEFMGFNFAPKVNAASRVGESGDVALGFLCTPDITESSNFYRNLVNANEERQDISSEMLNSAFNEAKQQYEAGRLIILVYLPEGHSGISGIVASRLKEQFNRPAIMLAPINSKEATGSARSIPGLDIRQKLIEIDEKHPGILNRYGGHSAAAGLTCNISDIDKLGDKLDELIRAEYSYEDLVSAYHVDFDLNSCWDRPLNIEDVSILEGLKPYGQNFPPPTFVVDGTVSDMIPIGKKEKIHLKFKVVTTLATYDCVWFSARLTESEDFPISEGSFYSFVAMASKNFFRNNVTLQLMIQGIGERFN